MNKEILLVVEAVSNEKAIEREVIFTALEYALAQATRKSHHEGWDVRVEINRQTGDYTTYRRWTVIDDEGIMENNECELYLDAAQKQSDTVAVGDVIEELIPSIAFGRIATQAAKQVIVQKVREAERLLVVKAYQDRVGELLIGEVKRVERAGILLDMGGNVEAWLARDELIQREMFKNGDRVRAYLKDVRSEPRGPQLFMSRTAPEFLMALFRLEVPEIGQGLIEIKAAARDPGIRAKVAVQAKDKRIDPVGVCVGIRGARVNNITNELAGERIDIVVWEENIAQFVINAMSPAQVESLSIDEEANSMDIAVSGDIGKAIGKGGQNVQLASRLTGWRLNVMSTEEANQRLANEQQRLIDLFTEKLEIDEEIAQILLKEGFETLEQVAYVEADELLNIEEFDEDIVEELQKRARDALLTSALVTAERANQVQPAEDLLQMDGMSESMAYQLAEQGVVSREDLADLAVDELQELVELDDLAATKLILSARGLA